MIGFGACPSLIGAGALRRRMAKIARELTVVTLSHDSKSARKDETSFLLGPGFPGLFFLPQPLARGRGKHSTGPFRGCFFNQLKQGAFPSLTGETGPLPQVVVFEPYGLDAALEIA
jgi:hypothetical protein